MKNKKNLLLVAAILILAIVSIGTYAIYKSSATGTSGFKTAKWYIELNGTDITTNNTFTFDLTQADWTHDAVITPNDDTVQVIAPGSYGIFGIDIDASETEVDVDYTISAIVKKNNTEIDLSTENTNLSLGFYENDELKGNPLSGSIAAHGTYNGELRIIWEEVDEYFSNLHDVEINNRDYVIEVTVVTKQKAKPVIATTVINEVEGLVDIAGAKRYVGANPNNYVNIDDKPYRIIGVYGDKLKVVSTEIAASRSYNSEVVDNAWATAQVNTYINTTYYNSLSDLTKSMIYDEGTWNVGIVDYYAKAADAYTDAQTTTWTGKIGLVAVYEYLYSTSDTSCYDVKGNKYGEDECAYSSWLFLPNSNYMWLMNPSNYHWAYGYHIIGKPNHEYYHGDLNHSYPGNTGTVFPVMYLKSDVVITGGSGTETDPYVLSI